MGIICVESVSQRTIEMRGQKIAFCFFIVLTIGQEAVARPGWSFGNNGLNLGGGWSLGKTPGLTGGAETYGPNYNTGAWTAGAGYNPFSKNWGAGLSWRFRK